MKYRFLAIASACALAAIAACGGHNGSSPLPSAGLPSSVNGPTTFAWGQEQLAGATYVGPANVGHMQVYVTPSMPNAQGLVAYADQVSDPASALYRQFLTPQQIADRFGASKQDYQTAANYFVHNGLIVGGWPQRLMLSVSGSQRSMEKAFATTFGVYTKNGVQFIAPRSTPRFSAAIPVTHVGNLVTLRKMHTYWIPAPPRANGNDTMAYSPQQIRAAFDYSGAYGAGFTGTGITVAIIGTGPINVPRSGTNPCGDQDLAALASLYNNASHANVCEHDVTTSGVAAGLAASGIPTAPPGSPAPDATPSPNPGVSPTSMFPYSGDFQTPPPVSSTQCSGGLPTCNPEDVEAQLDTQQIAFLAPSANVDFYLAYNAGDCYVFFPQTCNPASQSTQESPAPQLGIVEADPEIQQVIAENAADVVSISYGLGETQTLTAGPNPNDYQTVEFAAMATEGMAVFVSSGDSGSAECLTATSYDASQTCVSYPASDPHVTSVGGVNLPINEFGQLTANMTAWGVTNGGNGLQSGSPSGSGGGTSVLFTAPSWQQTAIGASMREQPDVSLDGDPLTGVTIYTNGAAVYGGSPFPGGPAGIGGTSVAAPEMAAMWALVLDACKNHSSTCASGGTGSHPYRLGNAAPYFYSIYHGSNLAGSRAVSGFPFLPYANVFYDVVYGSNTMPGSGGANPTPIPGDVAGTGYDEVTGLGVPFARHLITAVTNQ